MTDPHPTPHRWLILGAGGHGRCVAVAIRAIGDAVHGFLDDGLAVAELVAGAPVLGPLVVAIAIPPSGKPCSRCSNARRLPWACSCIPLPA